MSVQTHTQACVDPRKWSRIPTLVPHYAHIMPGAPHFCLTPHSQQGPPPSLAKAPVPYRCLEAPDPPPPCGWLHGCQVEPEASRFLWSPQVPRAERSLGARICTHPQPRLSRRPARTYWSWPLTPTPRRPERGAEPDPWLHHGRRQRHHGIPASAAAVPNDRAHPRRKWPSRFGPGGSREAEEEPGDG